MLCQDRNGRCRTSLLDDQPGGNKYSPTDDLTAVDHSAYHCPRTPVITADATGFHSLTKQYVHMSAPVQNQILINSSLTALGVNTPLSVIKADIR